TKPILVDAVCPQLDGLRFFELLPIDAHRIFVSENFCSDTSELNEDRISKSLRSYVERRGWKIKTMERQEKNALPMPLTAESVRTSVTGEALLIGARGGYFHSTTCQSLADTVRFAEHLAKLQELTTNSARDSLMRFRRSWLSRQRFYRLVNRLIFNASEPTLRYQVLQRFYELPTEMLARFQGGRTSWADRLRIITGKSPLPFKKAVRHFTERSAQDRHL
ncbi:MAG TPA: lycopene cyclase family protein, partial [Bdellovibrionales bacterium]|nr:lycopene cyclase family protein [Bdellovibrionales bacterium]